MEEPAKITVECVVAGGGIAGLMTAARLAAAGIQVVLLEARATRIRRNNQLPRHDPLRRSTREVDQRCSSRM
ncbi:FAD-dependent oxidoreductase [Nocardia sp. NPDC051463]|uniref:FAD-dependent oxidoreductase n=1 Tax=Nocardia sp. NPDC051463 TaxID=3154845 RepID=UPI0034350ACC